jgi:DNA-binding transcriptional ArsR family regulator
MAMTPHMLDPFQVIADTSRRQMLQLLSLDKLTINALAANFDMSRPAVSKHIKILQEAGFISIEDIGRERHCMLKQEGFNELRRWLNYYDQFWASKLSKLGDLMNAQNPQPKNQSSLNQ